MITRFAVLSFLFGSVLFVLGTAGFGIISLPLWAACIPAGIVTVMVG